MNRGRYWNIEDEIPLHIGIGAAINAALKLASPYDFDNPNKLIVLLKYFGLFFINSSYQSSNCLLNSSYDVLLS